MLYELIGLSSNKESFFENIKNPYLLNIKLYSKIGIIY
jgi:hypothetical protein